MSTNHDLYPERIIPDETPPGIVAIHLKRYEFARPFCVGKDVIDAACGAGYGSAFLAVEARSVLGVDIDADAIAYARSRYAGPGIEFACMDILDLNVNAASFDVVCSFETLEHLSDPARAVAGFARALRPDGVLILSTPRADETTHAPDNPFHRVELSVDDLHAMLTASFDTVSFYGQHRSQTRRHKAMQRLDVLGLRRRIHAPRAAAHLLGTRTTAEVTLDDLVIDRRLDKASEVVAVCTGPLP